MKKYNTYAVLGLKALRRAAAKVAEDANRNNYKIPFWENGKIVYKTPAITTRHKSKTSKTRRQEA